MSLFNHPEYRSHEQVSFITDDTTGLKAIIAIHNTQLGPAVGGCRMFPYVSDDDALTDVLRLSRGMTYKSALAGLPFGGGKSVIMGDPRHQKTPAMMRAMGAAVEQLGGRYIIAEDSGTSPTDLRLVAENTRHVSGIEDNINGGDPSPSTAYGVFLGIKNGLKCVFGSEDLRNRRIAIQGLGHVGFHLAALLRQAGAQVLGSDIHQPNMARATRELGVIEVPHEDILSVECDVLAPCALGGVINKRSIPSIRASVIAGAANNQLEQDDDDELLLQRGITYCPDFAINAGGIIEVFHQRQGSTSAIRKAALEHIGVITQQILEQSRSTQRPPQEVAIAMAAEKLRTPAHQPAAEILKVS